MQEDRIVTIIYLAAGQGIRAGSDTPKQFVQIGKYPLWYYAAAEFAKAFDRAHWIFVFPEDRLEQAAAACKDLFLSIHPERMRAIAGGETRCQSVRNALTHIPDERGGTVFIHDAARCFLKEELILRLYEDALLHQAAIPVVLSQDSMRIRRGDYLSAIDRRNVFHAQTPQVFSVGLLKKSHADQASRIDFTDDASVVEASGFDLHFSEGDYKNSKVTRTEDLLFAAYLLA